MHTTTTIDYADLRSYACRLLTGRGYRPETADDLAQEVTLKLWIAVQAGRLTADRKTVRILVSDVRRDAARYAARHHREEVCEAIADLAVDREASTDVADQVERLLPYAGSYRPAVERWARGDVLTDVERKSDVPRGLQRIREYAAESAAS